MKQNKPTLREILSSDAVAGRIIRDVSSLEVELDLILTRYFTAQERFKEFFDIIINCFTLAEKIEILRKMELPVKMISRENAVKSLEKFRKLRNILAHGSVLDDYHINKIKSNNELNQILSDYPKNYKEELRLTKVRLNRLYISYISKGRRKQRLKEYEILFRDID